MESNSPDVLLVSYTSGAITEYVFSTEATTVATPSTTLRTISVKKFATASTSSNVQSTDALSAVAVAVTNLQNTLTSTTSSSSIFSSSSWTTSMQSSRNSTSTTLNTSAAVRATSTIATPILDSERAASTSLSRTQSAETDIVIQTTSLIPPPSLLPTSTETLLALPTTSAPKFTHTPLPSPSQEPPSRKPLTITFTTLGSVSLVLLLVTFFFFRRRRRRWNGGRMEIGDEYGGREVYGKKRWSVRKRERGGRRTVYELITSANVHEKDGESVDIFTKPATPLKSGSLRSGSSLGGCLKEGMKGSFRRGRERVYELECEEREEVNWMGLKNRVRERTVQRLGSSLGIEGKRGLPERVGGRGGAKTRKSVRWAFG